MPYNNKDSIEFSSSNLQKKEKVAFHLVTLAVKKK